MSRSAIAALILANLLVAVQAVRGGWGYYETLLIYWCEALIIGAYNVVRLLLVGVLGRAPLGATIGQWVDLGPWYNRLFLTVVGAGFFVAKFGAFALAVGFLVVALPAGLPDTGSSRDMRVLEGLRAVGPGLFIAVVALLVSHGVSFVRNFLLRREYLHMNVTHRDRLALRAHVPGGCRARGRPGGGRPGAGAGGCDRIHDRDHSAQARRRRGESFFRTPLDCGLGRQKSSDSRANLTKAAVLPRLAFSASVSSASA